MPAAESGVFSSAGNILYEGFKTVRKINFQNLLNILNLYSRLRK